ncbi:SigE family RNA polymerase sigma factor [Streptomyces fuscigenes]|uniref:SigE family RNA polymerase sigma factor n=1 Tax=Streptomyces fuscigenes TaxID=1528880 RepID=UPI001F2362B2|nr:SigE family RNA polymerase sigma factor [Streptomyces fuscigenes]MCF3960797.1 SigE family RNA polymerase sigma factor [Streptomyces fuscigenes]
MKSGTGRAGRVDGFREFAASRAGQLFRSACLLTSGDVHLAEDLVQETLGRMYTVWGRSHVENPAAYAQSVLVRCFLTYRRRRSATERPLGELPEGAARSAGDADLRIALLDALAQLAPKDRAVVVLRYWEDRSIEETAEAMSVSAAAIRTRSVRALAKLRAQLDGEYVEFVAS